MFDLLRKVALAAGEIQLTYFRHEELDIAHKTSHKNIVTKADTESQDMIERTILQGMQQKGISADDVGFIGEENLHSAGTHLFVIDPIDGTSNFASGVDYFCSSIAYFKEGNLTAGIIYRPVHDELYFAEKGKGAIIEFRKKSEELRMRPLDSQDQLMTTNFGDTLHHAQQLPLIEKLLPHYRGVRAFGAVALDLAKVAQNEIGLTVDRGPYIWDIAAGKIIIEESDGVMFDWEGNDIELDLTDRSKRYSLISCHREKKEAMVDIIQHV